MLESGAAYHDSATAGDVESLEGPTTAAVAAIAASRAEEPGAAVRLRVPEEGETMVEDLVHGPSVFPNRSYDDFVIARGDGSVLYNFAVAVDDAEMGITDVVRGDDHLSNTPEADPGPARTRPPATALRAPAAAPRSRRQEALQATWRRLGAGAARARLPAGSGAQLPGALGWGSDDDTTLMSTEELVKRFRVQDVGTSAAIFDERKLRWINGRFMRGMSLDEYTATVARHLGREPDQSLRLACEIAQEKAQTLEEVWPLIRFLFEPPVDDPEAWAKVMGEGAGSLLRGGARCPWRRCGLCGAGGGGGARAPARSASA